MKRKTAKAKTPVKRAAKRATTAKRNSAEPFPARPFVAAGVRVPSLGVMARGAGVSLPLVSLILSGKRMLSVIVGMKLGGFLGVSVERLAILLYGEDGLVPRDSPIMKRLAKEGFPSQRHVPQTRGGAST